MKAIIVEDDLIVADHLKLILIKHGIQVLGIIDSVEEAITSFSLNADLYFVDIRLSGSKSGIELGELLNEQKIPFIYVTANNEMSTLKKATKTSPQAYITKPYKESDIVALLEIFKVQHEQSFIVNAKHGKKPIKLSKILFFESEGPYIKVVTKEEVYIGRNSLNKLEKQFSNHFIRVHRSFLINRNKIEQYSSKSVYVSGGIEIPISRSYKNVLSSLKA